MPEFEEELIDPFQSSVDWNSPPIYDIDFNDGDILEVIYHMVNTMFKFLQYMACV